MQPALRRHAPSVHDVKAAFSSVKHHCNELICFPLPVLSRNYRNAAVAAISRRSSARKTQSSPAAGRMRLKALISLFKCSPALINGSECSMFHEGRWIYLKC